MEGSWPSRAVQAATSLLFAEPRLPSAGDPKVITDKHFPFPSSQDSDEKTKKVRSSSRSQHPVHRPPDRLSISSRLLPTGEKSPLSPLPLEPGAQPVLGLRLKTILSPNQRNSCSRQEGGFGSVVRGKGTGGAWYLRIRGSGERCSLHE